MTAEVLRQVRQEQVEFVGSEAVYQRLSKKTALLELDPFLVYKQMVLVTMRSSFLRHKLPFKGLKLTLICTLYYDQVVRELKSISENTINLVYNLDAKSDVLHEPAAKFSVAPRMHYLLDHLHRDKPTGPCLCTKCEESVTELKKLIKMFPESVKLFEQFNKNESFLCSNNYGKVKSLKDICLLRVVEYDLSPESLPGSLQQTLRLGPETDWLVGCSIKVKICTLFSRCKL